MRFISRKSGPINLIVYFPKSEEGRSELVKRVADVHVDMVGSCIQKLNCSTEQKLKLFDAVIADAKKRAGVQTS